jgi:hypothetical protein
MGSKYCRPTVQTPQKLNFGAFYKANGEYQVIKKWLSYREHGLLGRVLTTDEAREVTHMARRIAAIVLLYPVLDTNYMAVKQTTLPWSSLSKSS